MKLFKLTDSDFCTHKNTKWGENVTQSVTGEVILCKNALHAYTDPRLAVIFNPIHSGFTNPILWEAEGNVVVKDHTKVGCDRLTTIRQIPIPKISNEQLVKFAILCAKKVCIDKKFNDWADKWLSGEDRTGESALRAADAADDTNAAYYAAVASDVAYTASYININLIEVLDEALQTN